MNELSDLHPSRVRPGKRIGSRAIAAGAVAIGLVLGGALPAQAFGSVSFNAPYGCTGTAYGASSTSGGFVYAETIENGNFCWPGYFQNVKVGLYKNAGVGGIWYLTSRKGKASLSGTQSTVQGPYLWSYHAWGNSQTSV